MANSLSSDHLVLNWIEIFIVFTIDDCETKKNKIIIKHQQYALEKQSVLTLISYF